ncbi:MAG: MATE family efflux transporter [Ruminococcaceae bacterium]|nr:MATE family efflux transporter [Oscillospiraceae bacterium]
MTIQLSDHFTYKKLLRFTFPSIIMMIFSSVYGVVDGFFVSNFVGKTPFAAVNFIMPFLMILGTLGFMFGAGGSALVSKTLGEGDNALANKYFSMLVYISIACGIVLSALGIVFLRPISALLGADGQLLEDCVTYGRTVLIALPAFMLQMEFQTFFITAEKPQLGLYVTVASGVANMVLDALFVGVFRWGLVGAAAATGISQAIGGFCPVLFFALPNSSILRLTRTKFYGKAFFKTCTNGSSELMSNISMSLVGMLYNIQLMKYAGENGVAAYGVLMYVNMIFISAFIGYSIGTAPIVGFHYGAENHSELKSLVKKSLTIIGVLSLAMLLMGLLLAVPLSEIFVGYDVQLLAMTVKGFYVFSFSFLFAGVCIYGSSFFTALNNGLVSAIVSFLRTLVFQIAAVMLLPIIWGIDGIWFSIVVAELMAFIVTILFLYGMKNKYHY